MNQNYKIKVKDFKQSLGEAKSFDKDILLKIKKYSLTFKFLEKKKLPEIYSLIFKKINNKKTKIKGSNRLRDWENGWNENFQDLKKKKKIKLLTPKWFKPLPLRWEKNFVSPVSHFFEFKFKDIFLNWLFLKYFKKIDNIYEFGCGSGTSLILLRKIFPNKNLTGLDWSLASGKIINYLNEKKKYKISYQRFNFYDFNQKLKLPENLGVFTIGALEQTGKDYKKFTKYLIKNKVKICINVECMNEFYDDKKFYLDKLAKIYHYKRGYLTDYLMYLKKLQSRSLIKIIKIKKQKLGSFYHEPYNYVVWKTL